MSDIEKHETTMPDYKPPVNDNIQSNGSPPNSQISTHSSPVHENHTLPDIA